MNELTTVQTWILIVAIYGTVAASYFLVPAIRIGGRYFAVPVDEAFRSSAEGRHVRLKYWLTVFGWMLVAMAIHTTAPTTPGVPIVALLVQVAGATHAMTQARMTVLPYARTEAQIRTASLVADESHVPGGLVAIVAPFAMLALTALYLEWRWADLPARFADHYTARDVPAQWVEKSLSSVFGPLAKGAAVLFTVTIGMFAISRGAPAGTASARVFRQTTLRTQVVGLWLLAGQVAYLSVSRFSEQVLVSPWVMFTVLLLALAMNAWPLIRLSMQSGSAAAPPTDGWKLGILYYNPQDPAVMVQRRFTVGYTLNFGNRLSWAYVGGVIALGATLAFFRS